MAIRFPVAPAAVLLSSLAAGSTQAAVPPASLSPVPIYDTRIDADEASGSVGSLVHAGDLNGDGYGDLLLPRYYRQFDAPSTDPYLSVYYGGPDGISSDQAGETLSGYQFSSVAGPGDLNGDGYDDIAIAAPSGSSGEQAEGLVQIHYGGPEGIRTTPDLLLQGNQPHAEFGSGLGGGDVNGDGYADLVVGARGYDDGGGYRGRVFVYFGGPAGLDPVPAVQIAATRPGTASRRDNGLGYATDASGDVNGDGLADIVATASGTKMGRRQQGTAFVYLGSTPR